MSWLKMKSVNQLISQSTSQPIQQRNSSHNSEVSGTSEDRFESSLSFLTRHLRPLSLNFLNHKWSQYFPCNVGIRIKSDSVWKLFVNTKSLYKCNVISLRKNHRLPFIMSFQITSYILLLVFWPILYKTLESDTESDSIVK